MSDVDGSPRLLLVEKFGLLRCNLSLFPFPPPSSSQRKEAVGTAPILDIKVTSEALEVNKLDLVVGTARATISLKIGRDNEGL